MKKVFFLLIALMLGDIILWAQTQTAVLNHQGKLTVYHGSSALSSAVSASRRGDVITLSAGTFSSCTINKPLTIRGAGMFADVETQTGSTIVNGAMILKTGVNGDDDYHLSFEGINFPTSFDAYTGGTNAYNVDFIKCYVQLCSTSSTNNFYYLSGCHFYSCHVVSAISNNYYYNNVANPTFINCYVQIYPRCTNATYINCMVNWMNEGTNSAAFTIPATANFENCIILGNYYAFTGTAMNCLYVNKSGGTYNPFSTQTNETNYVASGYGIFDDFAGEYLWNANFRLTPANEKKYTGTDGTTVGMYGGAMPFTMVVDNPRIKKCEVAPKTTTDGKLNVNIEVLEGE